MPLKAISGILQHQTGQITRELGKLGPSEPTVPGEPAVPGESAAPGEPSPFLDINRQEPLVRTALGLDFTSASAQGKAFRVLQYITQLFIMAGLIRLFFRPKRLRFTAELRSDVNNVHQTFHAASTPA